MKLFSKITDLLLLCVFVLPFANSNAQDGFSVDVSSGCAPIVVNFTYTEGDTPSNLSWNFGNSNTLSGDPLIDPIILTPSISYTTPGSYTVSLTVTSSSGTATYVYEDLITVYDDPVANFTSDVAEGCGAFPVSFSDLSNSTGGQISEWNWDFGDGGSSNEQNPVHVYNTIGVYDVNLSVITENGCENTFSLNNYITAIDGVYPQFSLSDTISCTLPTSISISNLSSGAGILAYSWDFGNGSFSTEADPNEIVYSEFGDYMVNLQVSNDLGCTQSFSQTLIIQEFQVNFETDVNCLPSASYFLNQSDAQMNEYEWDFGDPASGTDNSSFEENPSHFYSNPGNYTVTLTSSINGECENTFSQEILVLESDPIDYTLAENFICNFPVNIPLTINNPDIDSYNWYVTNNEEDTLVSGDENVSSIDLSEVISDGFYNLDLELEFLNGCVVDLIDANILEVDIIQLHTIISPVNICEGETVYGNDLTQFSSEIDFYEWDWGDGNSSNNVSSENTYENAGDYTVGFSMSTSNGCTKDTTLIIHVGIPSSPSFTYPDTTICIEDGVPFTYTGDTSLVDEYIWLYDDEISADVANPSLEILNVDSIHIVSLITINNGCRDTITEIVEINALGPKAIFTLDQQLFCKEEAPFIIEIFNGSEVTSNTSYEWTYGADYLDTNYTETPGIVEYLFPGSYSIILSLSDSVNGCEHELIQEVLIDDFHIFFEDSAEHSCDDYFYTGSMRFEDALPITIQSLYYNWDFGNGQYDLSNFLDSNMVEVDYSETGSFLMTVNTTNEYGCADTVSQWVYVHPSPIANFAMDNPNQCPPYAVQVTNLSVEMDTSIIEYEYILNLDSNIYFYEEDPIINIDQSGTHVLSLVIMDGFGCSGLNSQTLTPYNIEMDYSLPSFLCYNTEYIIESNITSDYPPIEYLWEFGDGSFSVDSFPTVFIDILENDTLLNTITVFDSTGCTVVDSFYIYLSVPDINFDFQIEDAACPPMYSDFSITSSDSIINYTIDYGDGESNSFLLAEDAANISHVYDLPGNYDVSFTVTDIYGCSSNITADSLVFIPGPWAEFSFSPSSGCPPLEVNFEILSGNNADEFFWVFGDGNTSNIESPTHIYNLQGTYTPVLVLQDSANFSTGDSIPCIISVQEGDIVIDGPELEFEILEDTLCPGNNSSLEILNNTTTIPGFEISNFFWNYGDGGFSFEENPAPYSYDQAGVYSIILTVTTENGCEYTLEQEDAVTVIASPDIALDMNYDPTCPPQLVNFFGDEGIFNDPSIGFLWNFGDGNYSNDLNPIHYYTNDAIFYPSIELNYLGCDYTIPLNESIQTLPEPEAIIEASPIFNNNAISEINLESQSIDAEELEWWINGDLISSSNAITVPFSNQSLQVFLVAKNAEECSDTTFLAYDDFEWNVSNILTPNGDGVNDLFILNFGEFGTCIDLSVFNRWGRKVYEKKNYRNTWTGRNMKGEDLSDGTYFYLIDVCSKAKIEGYITIMH